MKKYLPLILSLGFICSIYADDTTNQFALQAGNIAGAAEQCGQDISVFIPRAKEAIKAMAPDPGDQADADSLFDKSVANALSNQSTVMRKFSCQDVLTTYNSLPLLRSDYQQSVIAVLAAHNSANTPTVAAQSTTQTVMAAQTQTVDSQVMQQPMQSAQDQSPVQQALQNEMAVTPNSMQQYVSGIENPTPTNNKTVTNNGVNNSAMNNQAEYMSANNFPTSNLPPSDNISTNQQAIYMANPDAPVNPN